MAVIVVKQLFGGLGRNFVNPALIGRVVMSLSFTGAMTNYGVPRLLTSDVVSSATPLQTIAEDFSQFANVVPGAYFFVGTTPREQDPATMPINHSPHYAPDEAALAVGVRTMLRATLDLLEQRE